MASGNDELGVGIAARCWKHGTWRRESHWPGVVIGLGECLLVGDNWMMQRQEDEVDRLGQAGDLVAEAKHFWSLSSLRSELLSRSIR